MLAFLVSACSQPSLQHEEVMGRYRLNKGNAEDVLILLSDGSYIHRYQSADGFQVADTASWKLIRAGEKTQVEFTSFSHYSRREFFPAQRVVRGLWIVDIDKNWQGKLRLGVDEDIGLYYSRE